MSKIIYFFLLLSSTFICCQNEISNERPVWLKNRISSLLDNQNNFGASITRYKWNNMYIYHVSIPVSSCAFCELYDQNGRRIKFSSDSLKYDFMNNKADGVNVWQWEKKH